MDHLLSKEKGYYSINQVRKISKKEELKLTELILFSLEELFPQKQIDF